MFAAPIMGAVGIASSIGGGILGAAGAQYAGRAQANMYNYQAAIAEQNAAIAKQDANYALASGNVQAQEVGLRSAQQIGQTKAAFGAGNLNLRGGSQSRVLASEYAVAQQSQGLELANAAKRAYGFEVQSVSDQAQANLDRMAALTSIQSGELGAYSSILGGIGQGATQFARGWQSGLFNIG